MSIPLISIQEARGAFLSRQLPSFDNTVSAYRCAEEIIGQLGYIQIDTISVVERSHHLVLHSRIPRYKHDVIDQLTDDKKIFEYWSHAAAFMPMKNFRFSLIRKNNYSRKYRDWKNANKKILKYVYERIKAEGPLRSKDFEDNRKKQTGWWDRKPSKDALEHLFHEGKLMILKRIGFQKVYDLTENVLPSDIDTSVPDRQEYYKHLITEAISSSAIAAEDEITYLRKYDRKIFRKVLNELIEDKKILRVHIFGLDKRVFYTSPDFGKPADLPPGRQFIRIISPFDNLVIQRRRLKALFDFDYQVECYVPASKRRFGYYCMPVLYGDKFIARIDLKADRKSKRLITKNFYRENNFRDGKQLKKSLYSCLARLAKFSGCDSVFHDE